MVGSKDMDIKGLIMQVGQYGQLIYRELHQALGASQLHRRGHPGEFPFPRT